MSEWLAPSGVTHVQKALFAESIGNGVVACHVCPRECHLGPGQTGRCHVRHNVDGVLLSSSYGRPVAVGVEPIEKKPLFHAFPCARTLSLGAAGCNLTCAYCLNAAVAQRGVDRSDDQRPPEAIVEEALTQGVECIAFTYTELTTFVEYALEIADLAHDAGLRVVAKSNGFLLPPVVSRLAHCLDAINIDLKAWLPDHHLKLTGVPVEPVLETLQLVRRLGLWLEVTTPIVPGLNDTPPELDAMADFIASTLGRDTPWHLLRFYPTHRMADRPATSPSLLMRAADAAANVGLRYVYSRDVPEDRLRHTRCPECRDIVIERGHDWTIRNKLNHGTCQRCGTQIPGVGLAAASH